MEKVTTGDVHFDGLLGGGFEPGSLVVLGGAPGTGKTILAQQVCFANATAERKAIYFTTWSEPHEKLVSHLSPFSFFENEALGDRVEFIHLPGLIDDDRGLGAAADEILRRSFEARPAVIVVDSSKALHDVVDPAQFRRSVYDLASKVAYSNAVLIFVGEYSTEETRSMPEFAVADAIVQLENEAHGPVDRRWLRVLKLRGAEPTPGQHSFRITSEGFRVSPRLETTLPADWAVVEGRASFGNEPLDRIFGGGIPRGDSTLLLGPTGVGKTFLALGFLRGGLEQGERCLHLSFQESSGQVRAKASSMGIDSTAAGNDLVVNHVPPVEIDLDEVGAYVRDQIRNGKVRRVVVDSLAELSFAARDTDRLPAYVWALAGFIRAEGGTTVFTNEMAALGGDANIGGLSFLFDNVVLLRYVEIESEVRRAINVLKMRQSEHSRVLVEYRIGARGIELGDPLKNATGVLGWSVLAGS